MSFPRCKLILHTNNNQKVNYYKPSKINPKKITNMIFYSKPKKTKNEFEVILNIDRWVLLSTQVCKIGSENIPLLNKIYNGYKLDCLKLIPLVSNQKYVYVPTLSKIICIYREDLRASQLVSFLSKYFSLKMFGYNSPNLVLCLHQEISKPSIQNYDETGKV